MKKLLTTISIILVTVSLGVPVSVFSASSESSVLLTVTGTGAVCGNGTVETGEECDGSAGVPSGYQCNSSCELEEITTSGGGSVTIPFISKLKIEKVLTKSEKEEAVINWETNKDAIGSFEWGETQELMDGVTEKTEKGKKQRVYLQELKPDTDYYFRIYARDSIGRKVQTPIYKFRTKPLVDKKAPSNIDNFTAIAEIDHIILSWKNPRDTDFRAVKIIRSTEFYPGSIKDGVEVYNDSGEIHLDKNVEVGIRYYYTAFAYDNDANYSSGSIASAVIVIDEEVLVPSELLIIPVARPEEMIEVDFNNFEFFGANKTIKLDSSNGMKLLPGAILDVRTHKSHYPEVLKNIIITLAPKDSEEKEDAKSYLLRIDKDKEYYSTNFVSPVKISNYDIKVYFLNFSNYQIAESKSLLKIDKFGKVNNFNVRDLLINTVHAEEETVDDEEEERIYAAEITLYKYENGNFRKWDGNAFSQFNPMLSNEYGQYGFLVPNGYYLIKSRKDNYYKFESLPFQVKDNLINQNLYLIYYPQLDFYRYLVSLFIALVVYSAFRKFIKKMKRQTVTIG